MHIISSIILAFSASIDSLIIGLAYGIKRIKIGFISNIIIAIVVTLGTFISMYIGLILSKFIPKEFCSLIGSSMLICMGLWMLYDEYKKKVSLNNISGELMDSLNYDEILINDRTADLDHSGTIDIKEALTLALALSINNLALGISGSIAGLSIFLTTVFTFLFSILTLLLGLKIGNSYLSKFFGKYSSYISAFIIITMGISELIF